MPLNKDAFTRYRIIDNCLNNKQRKYPTKKYLAEACSRVLGKEISASTIEKDIHAMKEGVVYGNKAPIVYSKLHKGYIYDEQGFSINDLNLEVQEWEALAYASNLIYQYKEVPLFKSFKDAIEKIHGRFYIPFDHQDADFESYVQYEKSNSNTGYEWLHVCYQAFKNNYAIEISYENIYKQETKQYTILPYLLKEYRNRWYVIGWDNNREDYLTFGLDRIQDAIIIEKKQKRRNDFDVNLFLKNALGIMEGDGSATIVELEITAPIDRLISLEPLHHSQKTIRKTKKYSVIQMEVNINPELHRVILSLGAACKVIKPADLKKALRAQLTEMLSFYK
jgi:predicted DNA-binding transcriptional regulator YafY